MQCGCGQGQVATATDFPHPPTHPPDSIRMHTVFDMTLTVFHLILVAFCMTLICYHMISNVRIDMTPNVRIYMKPNVRMYVTPNVRISMTTDDQSCDSKCAHLHRYERAVSCLLFGVCCLLLVICCLLFATNHRREGLASDRTPATIAKTANAMMHNCI